MYQAGIADQDSAINDQASMIIASFQNKPGLNPLQLQSKSRPNDVIRQRNKKSDDQLWALMYSETGAKSTSDKQTLGITSSLGYVSSLSLRNPARSLTPTLILPSEQSTARSPALISTTTTKMPCPFASSCVSPNIIRSHTGASFATNLSRRIPTSG